MNEIIFLGTGGGRIVLVTQTRKTGGFRIHFKGLKIHVDPGPGAFVNCFTYGTTPRKTDIILVSHSHIDHMNDLAIMTEAMTTGGLKKRGYLVLEKNYYQIEFWDYIKDHVNKVFPISAGEEIEIKDLKLSAFEARHDVPTVGFRFEFKGKTISYTSDTEYFDKLAEFYRKSDVLILNVLRPRGAEWKSHLNTNDAANIVKKAKPRLAVLQHFGMKVLRASPWKEAEFIEKETGVKTIAATDGMRLNLEKIGEQETLKRFK